MSGQAQDPGAIIAALRSRIAEYERWFAQLDAQMRLLERERQKLSAVVTHTDAGFVVFDPSLRVAWSSDVFSGRFMAGDSPAQLAGRSCHETLCRQESECPTCPVRKTFREGGVFHHEINLALAGQGRHIYATSMPVKSPEGAVEQTIVMLQDVSDLEILRRSEEALRASEARFRSIFERTTAGMATVSADGRFLQVNPAMCAFLGYGEEELKALTVPKVTHPDDLPETLKVLRDRLKGAARHIDVEKRYVRKDGSVVWGRTSAAWMRGSDGAPGYSVALVQDITERKHLEQELRQAEKMSAVGQLIAGVAHELNNPLAGVLGYAQLLLGMPVNERIRRGLDAINREADRCKKIVHNLQTFARKQRPEVEPVDVNGILLSTLELRSYQLRVDDIEVVTDLAEDLPSTLADSHQLRQVFLNIVINAHQAMTAHRSSGCLTLKTRLRDDEIVVEIEDDGPGIDPANLGRIFDPFFTTKEVGQGTGLGLSICYGIVKEHGGRITASNSPDGGARFVITFPVRRPRWLPAARKTPSAGASTEHAPRSRILVVDDEESIGEVLSEFLENAGHSVDVAANGLEALSLIESGSYDLIISDLKMPAMGGVDLYNRIAERDPGLARRMVFSTGDTVSDETSGFLERSGARCVQKPFDLAELRRLVDELLTAPVS